MNTYRVNLSLECTYEVTAIDENTAIKQACEWFDEAMPNVEIEEIKTENK